MQAAARLVISTAAAGASRAGSTAITVKTPSMGTEKPGSSPRMLEARVASENSVIMGHAQLFTPILLPKPWSVLHPTL